MNITSRDMISGGLGAFILIVLISAHAAVIGRTEQSITARFRTTAEFQDILNSRLKSIDERLTTIETHSIKLEADLSDAK